MHQVTHFFSSKDYQSTPEVQNFCVSNGTQFIPGILLYSLEQRKSKDLHYHPTLGQVVL